MTYDDLTLTEIALRINTHLKRLERNPLTNPERREGVHHFWGANAWRNGSWIRVVYVSYQGSTAIPRAVALDYLRALDSGYTGRHNHMDGWLQFRPIRTTPPTGA